MYKLVTAHRERTHAWREPAERLERPAVDPGVGRIGRNGQPLRDSGSGRRSSGHQAWATTAVAADQPQRAEDRLRHDVLAVRQHLDVLGEPERPADGPHQLGAEPAMVAAVAVVVDLRRGRGREAATVEYDEVPGLRNTRQG